MQEVIWFRELFWVRRGHSQYSCWDLLTEEPTNHLWGHNYYGLNFYTTLLLQMIHWFREFSGTDCLFSCSGGVYWVLNNSYFFCTQTQKGVSKWFEYYDLIYYRKFILQFEGFTLKELWFEIYKVGISPLWQPTLISYSNMFFPKASLAFEIAPLCLEMCLTLNNQTSHV